MAKGKKTGGKDWKPGKEGGPGRPKLPEDIRKAKNLTITECRALLCQFLKFDIDQLEEVLRDKKRLVMEHWVARIALIGIKNGDQQRLNFMFDRLIGKVTDKIQHSLPKPAIIEKLNGEKMALFAKQEDEDG